MPRLRTSCFDAAAFAREVVASEGWRNAVDLHHLPGGTHSLAVRPGSLVRLTFQIGLTGKLTCPSLIVLHSSFCILHLNGPRGRTCTCTIEGLSFVPLPWATRGFRR